MFANNSSNATSYSGTASDDPFYNGLIGLLGGLAMFLNGPLLVVLVKSKSPVFLSRMNYLVGNLALADFLTGVAVFISALAIDNDKLVIFHFVMLWTTIGVSFITLLLMSVERLVVLSYPLTWPFILTTRRTLVSIAATWFVSIACGVAIYVFRQPAQFALIVIFEVSILLTVALHVVIYGYLRKRSAFSRKFSGIQEGKPTSDIQQASQSSATNVLLILVVILVVTVLPNILVLQLLISYPLGLTARSALGGLIKAHHYLYPIELLNFVVNPIVYAWRLKRYRKALNETFFALTASLCFVSNNFPNTVTEQMVKK